MRARNLLVSVFLLLLTSALAAGCLPKNQPSGPAQAGAKPSVNSASEELERSADQYQSSGNLDLALVQYEKAIRAKGAAERLYYKMGLAHLAKQGYGPALESFKQSLAADPNYLLSLQGAGFACYNLGNLGLAEDYLKKALALRQDLPLSHGLLGIIYNNQKKPELAQREFNEELKYAPSPDAYNNLGLTFMVQKKYSEAVESFKKGMRLAPLAKISNNLGLALCRQEKYDEALAAFKSAGSEASAYNNLGMCYMKAKDNQKAKEYFQKAIEANPKYYGVANENLIQAGGQPSGSAAAQQEAVALEQMTPSAPKLQEKAILENAQIKVEEVKTPPVQSSPLPPGGRGEAQTKPAVLKAPEAQDSREPRTAEVTPQVVTQKPEVPAGMQPDKQPEAQAQPQAQTQPQATAANQGKQERAFPEKPVEAKSSEKILSLSEARLVDEGSQVALYLGASGPMLQYSYFFKDSPAGLVLDVKGDWKLAVPSSLAVKSGFVDKIMFKAHSGNLRVIIELKAQQGKPLAEPVIEKLAQGLVVKLKK